jgi:transposase
MAGSRMVIGFQAFCKVFKFGVMFGWPIQRSDSGGCGTRTPSPVFVRSPRCAVSSVIRRRASSPLYDAQKKICGCCGRVHSGWYDRRTRRVRDLSCGDMGIFLEIEVRRVQCRRCGRVKRERLEFLADNPFYTKRFAHYVGRRCRQATIKDIAQELNLDWDTVKTLEMQYMRAQLARAGTPGPKAIGIDEISIKKRHTYRIVVSDLIRHRPIWFGGDGIARRRAWRRSTRGLARRKAPAFVWR